MPTLPGDDARRIMWGFADRPDLQLLVHSVRGVARGPVARLVALGARNPCERTPEKQELRRAYNNAGIVGLFNEPPQSGHTEGPRNLARALAAFELAWVDASVATGGFMPRDHGGIMVAARLLSAVEPLIRYQRGRFHGGSPAGPGSPRYELGLQLKDDAVHRLVDVWSAGEACAALGFEAARLLDRLETLERAGCPMAERAMLESAANVLGPACKLWHSGHGSRMMREAAQLMGGYGMTEDCPGFLGYKWVDLQMEAACDGPEAVRRQLGEAMTNELFLTQFRGWIRDTQALADSHPETGACALTIAMEMWLWTLQRVPHATGTLANVLCRLLASRSQILGLIELQQKGRDHPSLAGSLPWTVSILSGLCHVQAAHTAGEVGRVCAEWVYGSHRDAAGDQTAFRDMQTLLESSLAESLLAKDRVAEVLTQVTIPEAPDYPARNHPESAS